MVTGGEYGGAIGGYKGSGKITINGGVIETKTTHKYASIGHGCSEIEITGGTIVTNSPKFAAISCSTGGLIKITGGSILANGTIPIAEMNESKELVEKISTDGNDNLYVTPVQLQNVNEKVKVTDIVTSDNKNYGITDMYTSEEGILYLYLPEGERNIIIKTSEKDYEGTVITSSSNDVVILEGK